VLFLLFFFFLRIAVLLSILLFFFLSKLKRKKIDYVQMLCLIHRIHDGKMYFAVIGKNVSKIELLPYHQQQQQQQLMEGLHS
jgi:hypothetical protein